MRSTKSRSRGKSRGGSRSPSNNINRVFDSSGPEGKVRGTPQQIIDKYTQLARDAQLSNDRVNAENFQQHAEHYTRLLAEAQRDAEEKRAQADKANRERQQQKQREREERDRARDETKAAPVTDPGAAPQPDLVEVGGDDAGDDSGLVETPEMKPRRKSSRGRKPKPAPETDAGEAGEGPAEPAPGGGSSEAAE
jgi:hypothetical protein